jgi:1,4-alpha-glucan branching enzyme
MNNPFQINRRIPRIPVQRTVKPVSFYCVAPDAKSVSLLGDFNGWDPSSCPMQAEADGWWFAQVMLPHGHHQYQFLVDGALVLDPNAAGTTRNERDEMASLVSVS